MPNEFSNPYHLGESISKFRIFEWYFSFLLKFYRTICKQKNGHPDQMPRSVVFDLGLHSLHPIK